MTNVSLTASGRASAHVTGEEIAALATTLRGRACQQGDPGFDEARTIWNAMIDRRPGLVVRCAGAADVMHAVDFARAHDLSIAVKGAGHNIAGNAVCDDGLMIDLSPMTSVRVEPDARLAWVEPGVTLGALDRETQAFGLVVPTGINSATGIAGLTLGGGFGWTTRKLGLTIDNLLAADVVTADGRLLRASEDADRDLFWAIRGGGGNFGVVTAFEFRLNPLGPDVLAGLVVHPFDNAGALLRSYREAVAEAPDELTCWVVMRKAPPLPFLPPEWHGREVLVFAMCYAGDLEKGEKATAPLRRLGTPIADVVGRQNFVGWQSAFDPLLTPGARNYWKSHDFDALSDGAIETMLARVGDLPTPECEIFIAHLGGAMSRVSPEATPYPSRNAHFTMNVHTRWREAKDDAACMEWARALFKAEEPYATGRAYVNFMPADEDDRIERSYGENYRRLAELKHRYDPDNLFRMNQNIRPLH
jgi:FAD/FMN-containing dehydrogenase